MAKHWYRVDFQEAARERALCGSSELDPEQLMTELSAAAFIRLDDLFYRDNQNRFRSWSDWDPRVQPTALINVKAISFIMPLTEGPSADEMASLTTLG
ncbi:MAG: hypothetical protein QOF78_3818 [Phycisphaerales bacterium]|jgi:hypothetical protein|nr:hypothetical protein [Phycisphaerales bacterium]